MSDPFALDEFSCELRVNGVSIPTVRIRQGAESAGDLDVVVTDPVVGCFALHSGFEIDVPEPDSGWRRVSLDELKGILKSRYLLPAEDLPKASDIAECRLFARVDDIQIPCWERSRLAIRGGRKHACDTCSEFSIVSEFRIWYPVRRSLLRVCRRPGFRSREQDFGRVLFLRQHWWNHALK